MTKETYRIAVVAGILITVSAALGTSRGDTGTSGIVAVVLVGLTVVAVMAFAMARHVK